ncbi:MAG: PIN domain-containing protein [Deltaproteobacteria bacterium]|nr:PIN domain-containing protein [Deltaproteobacteria bacterium]
MVAIDTSSLVAYLANQRGEDVELVDLAFEQKNAVFPPVVLTELLSDSNLSREVRELFLSIPVLETSNGFWSRAGLLRASILAKGFKARLADALIAQSCIDHNVTLITRDRDFRHFAKIGRLRVMGSE